MIFLCGCWIDQCAEHILQRPDYLGHGGVVEFLRRVAKLMVIIGAEKGGVGDGKGGDALLPERPVVGPADAPDGLGEGHAPEGDAGVFLKDGGAFADERAGAAVAEEANVVGGAGQSEQRGKGYAFALRAGCVVAKRLGTEHADDFPLRIGGELAGVNEAPHGLALKKWRLLVDEGHEVQGAFGGLVAEHPG